MSTDPSVADELLEKLRGIAATGLVPSVMDQRADTAIGRTLESLLGIDINSRREPDYKGIEIKSYRRARTASRENRKTLFARVPNWKLSKFKSSAEILNGFGYTRGDDFKLYCTVSTRSTNSQGLSFKLDDKAGLLNECSSNAELGAFATWAMADLRKSLVEKHNETFWVGEILNDRLDSATRNEELSARSKMKNWQNDPSGPIKVIQQFQRQKPGLIIDTFLRTCADTRLR